MRKYDKKTPPPLANKLLFRFLRDDLKEEVSGDLEEKFQTMAEEKSLIRARMHYWYEVLNYCRPFAIRKKRPTLNNTYMFRNYLTISWRNLFKQKMYSAIKIGGFAIGIAACFMIGLYIQDELQFDKQYPDRERIYRVVQGYNDDGNQLYGVWFQAPFAKAIKDDFPEIEHSGRYLSEELFGAGSAQIRPADQVDNNFEEGFTFMDQELLEILKPKIVYGNLAHTLDEPRTMVITRRKAEKYFPNENPVGKLFVVNNREKAPFKIGGVIEDFPPTSHLQFDFIMTLKDVEFWPGEQSYWGANNYPTYILLKPGTNPIDLEKKMASVVKKYMLPLWISQGAVDANQLVDKFSFKLQPMEDIHLRSRGIDDGIRHGDIRFVWLFGAVAVFILLIAIINFVNLSTAKSANRAKEVGLRKTIGSFRSNIISQFLTESILFSALSFVIGMLIAWLALPYFNVLAVKSLVFPWTDWWLFPMIVVASLFVGLLAGLYPSFYLSGFRPIEVLKGNLSRGSKSGTMRSGLVVFQFTTSIVLIISTFVIYQQVNFILNKKIGFEKDQVILLHGTNSLRKQILPFKEELLSLSQVTSVSASDYLPIDGTKRNGNSFWKEGKVKEEKSVGVQKWRVDFDYIKTLGMKIVDGRDFDYKIASDSQAAVINQSMVRDLGLVNPIGQGVTNGDEIYKVIGVVEDFNFQNFKSKIGPVCLTIGNSPGIVSVKVNSTDIASTLQAVEATWRKFSPHQPIRFTFLDENYARMYDDVKRMGKIFTTFALLAIIVACLGLFALSAFMVEQRSKEISIRLVLGASLNSIFSLLTFNFLKLVFMSIFLAAPIGWFLMNAWLQDYSYRTTISWDVFVVSGLLAILIALITISYQALRAALMNPAKSLKSE